LNPAKYINCCTIQVYNGRKGKEILEILGGYDKKKIALLPYVHTSSLQILTEQKRGLEDNRYKFGSPQNSMMLSEGKAD